MNRNPYQKKRPRTSLGNDNNDHHHNNDENMMQPSVTTLPLSSYKNTATNAASNSSNDSIEHETAKWIGDSKLLEQLTVNASTAKSGDPPKSSNSNRKSNSNSNSNIPPISDSRSSKNPPFLHPPRPPTINAHQQQQQPPNNLSPQLQQQAQVQVQNTTTNHESTSGDAPSSTSTIPADPQQKQLALIQSLQTQLEEAQEANFDLQATLATLEAEQKHAWQQLQAQQEATLKKAQHSWRLEQQQYQRQLQQLQSSNTGTTQTNAHPTHTDDVFSRRLGTTWTTTTDNNSNNDDDVLVNTPTTGPPPEITTTTMTTTPSPVALGPPPITRDPTRRENDAFPFKEQLMEEENGVWLARQLLWSITSNENNPKKTDSSSTSNFHPKRYLEHILSLAADDTNISTSENHPGRTRIFLSGPPTLEHLVQDFLSFTHPTMTTNHVSYWQGIFQHSRRARKGVWNAMLLVQEEQEQKDTDNHANDNVTMEEEDQVNVKVNVKDTEVTDEPRPRKCRIHRLQTDGRVGDPLLPHEENGDYCNFDEDKVDVWDVEIVKHWIQQLNVSNTRHVQILSSILEDSEGSTWIWWNFLWPRIIYQILGSHGKITLLPPDVEFAQGTRKKKSKQNRSSSSSLSSASHPFSLGGASVSFFSTPGVLEIRRRIRMQAHHSMAPKHCDEKHVDAPYLTACLELLEALIQVTRPETLQEDWYGCFQQTKGMEAFTHSLILSSEACPVQPFEMEDLGEAADQSILFLIGLLLDMLDMGTEDYFGFNENEKDDEDDSELIETGKKKGSAELPEWYCGMISLFMTIGQTPDGIKGLRTRLPDRSGGDVLPNVVDTAVLHLFQLSLKDDDENENNEDQDNRNYRQSRHSTKPHPRNAQRLRAMDYWIRLLQQLLHYVLHHEGEEKISFRSLLLDTYDYYQSAVIRVLADPFVSSETSAILRMQLEELALDEEEFDESRSDS